MRTYGFGATVILRGETNVSVVLKVVLAIPILFPSDTLLGWEPQAQVMTNG